MKNRGILLMKKFTIIGLIFLFSFCCLSFSAFGVTVTLTQNFTGDKYPEGGYPNKTDHYNQFSFTLNISGLATNKYYKIRASLSSSKYKGYAANLGSTTAADLQFHPADNPGWTTVTATHLGSTYGTDSRLQSVPGKITARCFDWAAQGSVTVTVVETDENGNNPRSVAPPQTKSIPYDENKNGIADGWEDMSQSYEVVVNGVTVTRSGYKPELDDEVAPDEENTNNGDGWSIYDEWRGIFAKKTDRQVTRLDPKQKDVMYCVGTGMEDYGSSASFKKHSYHELDPAYVKDAWGTVFNGNSMADTVHEDTGRVNVNSAGGDGCDPVPGYRPVWAIRIAVGDNDDNPKGWFGQTSGGSPSQYTLIEVFVTRINSVIDARYADAQKTYNEQGQAQYAALAKKETDAGRKKAYNELAKTWTWPGGTADNIKAAKKFRIGNTLTHEVVHDHNINSHCTHRLCYMKGSSSTDTRYQIDPKTGKLVIKVGRLEKSLSVNSSHESKLAVTGKSNAGVIACDFDTSVSFGEITAEMLGIGTQQTTTTTTTTTSTPAPVSASLSPADGSSTATPGSSYTVNVSVPSGWTRIYWYIKSPSESGYGTSAVIYTSGDSSSTSSSYTYSIPDDASGDYVLTAYVYVSDNTIAEPSYTVSVSYPSIESNEDDLTHWCPWCSSYYDPNNNYYGACRGFTYHDGFASP